MIRSKKPAFRDGVLTVCTVENVAAPGKRPVNGLRRKVTLRYDERTVGLNRYYTAKQDNVRVDAVLRCPRRRDVCAQDIAIPIDGQQYEIKLVQYPENIVPPVMDLTLTRLESPYEIRET